MLTDRAKKYLLYGYPALTLKTTSAIKEATYQLLCQSFFLTLVAFTFTIAWRVHRHISQNKICTYLNNTMTMQFRGQVSKLNSRTRTLITDYKWTSTLYTIVSDILEFIGQWSMHKQCLPGPFSPPPQKEARCTSILCGCMCSKVCLSHFWLLFTFNFPCSTGCTCMRHVPCVDVCVVMVFWRLSILFPSLDFPMWILYRIIAS